MRLLLPAIQPSHGCEPADTGTARASPNHSTWHLFHTLAHHERDAIPLSPLPIPGSGAVDTTSIFTCRLYSDMAGPETFENYKTPIYLAGSASAEFFADIGLCAFEAVKVRFQYVACEFLSQNTLSLGHACDLLFA